jgi:hypothetical protein
VAWDFLEFSPPLPHETPEGKSWAKQIYAKAKAGYHATTVEAVEKIVR